MNRCKKMTYYAKNSGPYPFTQGIRVRFSDPFNPFNPQSDTNVGRFAQDLTKSKKIYQKNKKIVRKFIINKNQRIPIKPHPATDRRWMMEDV